MSSFLIELSRPYNSTIFNIGLLFGILTCLAIVYLIKAMKRFSFKQAVISLSVSLFKFALKVLSLFKINRRSTNKTSKSKSEYNVIESENLNNNKKSSKYSKEVTTTSKNPIVQANINKSSKSTHKFNIFRKYESNAVQKPTIVSEVFDVKPIKELPHNQKKFVSAVPMGPNSVYPQKTSVNLDKKPFQVENLSKSEVMDKLNPKKINSVSVFGRVMDKIYSKFSSRKYLRASVNAMQVEKLNDEYRRGIHDESTEVKGKI